jgi:SulP family sulfate permease
VPPTVADRLRHILHSIEQIQGLLADASQQEFAERIKRENGALAQALLTYVIQVMAERLSFASKVIGVLRR